MLGTSYFRKLVVSTLLAESISWLVRHTMRVLRVHRRQHLVRCMVEPAGAPFHAVSFYVARKCLGDPNSILLRQFPSRFLIEDPLILP